MIVIQPDGKTLVVGRVSGGWAILRYNADGSADSTFGLGTFGACVVPVNVAGNDHGLGRGNRKIFVGALSNAGGRSGILAPYQP